MKKGRDSSDTVGGIHSQKRISKKSALSFWIKEMLKVFSVAVLQALCMIGILSSVLGFEPVSMVKTVSVACMAAMSFMMLFYFFNLLFGKIGSFILLVFMVLQLSGAAGTYPIELSDSFYQKLHPYMPFTYTVNAFRSTTANGLDISKEILILITIMSVFFILNLIGIYIKSDDNEEESLNKKIKLAEKMA